MRLDYAAHTAHLSPLYGAGLLTRPRPADDVLDPQGGSSLHEVEWAVVLADLDAFGWEVGEGDEHGDAHFDVLPDGRERVVLFGRDPVVTMPTMREQAEALTELSREVL